MLDPIKIEEKIPAFAKELAHRHAPQSWQDVLKATAVLLTGLGQQDLLSPDLLADIKIPVLLLLGDRDKMVPLDETVTAFKQLPNSQLAILPATAHPIEQVDVIRLCFEISNFMI
jgi:pimeloyl-ACP methyl ester carboxylesterase